VVRSYSTTPRTGSGDSRDRKYRSENNALPQQATD
jgi:hypothetical protein